MNRHFLVVTGLLDVLAPIVVSNALNLLYAMRHYGS